MIILTLFIGMCLGAFVVWCADHIKVKFISKKEWEDTRVIKRYPITESMKAAIKEITDYMDKKKEESLEAVRAKKKTFRQIEKELTPVLKTKHKAFWEKVHTELNIPNAKHLRINKETQEIEELNN